MCAFFYSLNIFVLSPCFSFLLSLVEFFPILSFTVELQFTCNAVLTAFALFAVSIQEAILHLIIIIKKKKHANFKQKQISRTRDTHQPTVIELKKKKNKTKKATTTK